VEAYPHEEGRLVSGSLVAGIQGVLDLHGALQCLDRVAEVYEEGIADGLDDGTVPLECNAGHHGVVIVEQFEGACLVLLHHPRESDDVGVHDRRQAIVFLFHTHGAEHKSA